ncbi:MAG TPA: hypothetical protein VNL18_10410 [Gemmatimonadales bacterium]|nr:hypothetical protein [Gemmatimonadales bacterium]
MPMGRAALFYDRFGEEIVTELVNWFNDVDATYRTDLRELNELNFTRFDAKLEQRLAELAATTRATATLTSVVAEEWSNVRRRDAPVPPPGRGPIGRARTPRGGRPVCGPRQSRPSG